LEPDRHEVLAGAGEASLQEKQVLCHRARA